MLRIPFEFKFGFERFKSLSNGSNLRSNASKPFRMVQICIRTLRIPFEWIEFAFECLECISNALNPFELFELAFECFDYLSNGSNSQSNALNPKWFEFAFKCFKSLSNGSNLQSNSSNSFRIDIICIRMLRISFQGFEFGFECFKSLSNG